MEHNEENKSYEKLEKELLTLKGEIKEEKIEIEKLENELGKIEKELEMDEHETEKNVTLIVNAQAKKWDEKNISFEQVITLAFGSYQQKDMVAYHVDYSKGTENKPAGIMTKGDTIKVKNKMIFNVSQTNRS
jgi:predicted RNase H-like nuclease (RuvC/YqgF family)